MKRFSILLALAAFAAASPAYAELANIKVVTDANPDYSDMESMVHSITSNWSSDYDKMFALFYWDHIARRQTEPIIVHGYALTDPIRQYNDYGFTMCSTISGIKTSTWNYMGYPCRYFDIGLHTVPDVWYDGKFHHYDNSLSQMYTLNDGKTIAAVPDVGATMSGPKSNGQEIQAYVAKYNALFATSDNGFCQGADIDRSLKHIGEDCFKPAYLKYRSYFYDQDRGHRYSLNLRNGEVYTRFYSRQDVKSPNAVKQGDSDYTADPAYFVPNHGQDPETPNPRYHIRGNGERTWTPALDQAHLAESVYSSDNIKALSGTGVPPVNGGGGLVAIDPSKPASAVFKVQGANVITSLKIHADAPGASYAVSTTNGLQWTDLPKPEGDKPADIKLIKEVNANYEVLVKVTLGAAPLKSIAFNTITEINNHTQPTLHLGKNTVYVGNGDQSESIVFWPQLHGDAYKQFVFEEHNIRSDKENEGWHGLLYNDKEGQPGDVVFKIDAPTDLTSITYGGRIYNRGQDAHVDFLHSFDGGKTWKQDYSCTDNNPPWDIIHYETVSDIPAGTKSVLFKYNLAPGRDGHVSLYAIRMEANHKLATPTTGPVEVTFNWQERQKDYSTIKRSHTQIVDKLPTTYTINVGGEDQPIVDSLTVNLAGARGTGVPPVSSGYSDGKDVGGEKFVGRWATYGKNLAEGKPYTVSKPAEKDQWGTGDPDGKKLTDGVVGSNYSGGTAYQPCALWTPNKNPEITVDLGKTEKCAAFRIHTTGYEGWDAIKGENKDKVELLTSTDGTNYTSQGFFDFNLRWKDIPVNYMFNDDETFAGFNFMLAPKAPVEARYIKYKITSTRFICVSELQALDSFEFKPFDLKIALPDPAQNGKAPPNATLSPNPKKWADNEKPTDIGKEQHWK